MEDQALYTVTIVRNIGVPISFSIRRSRVLILLSLLILIFVIVIVGSIRFYIIQVRATEQQKQLEMINQANKLLKVQIAKKDQDFYWKNTDDSLNPTAIETALLEQSEFSTKEIWVTKSSKLKTENTLDSGSVKVSNFKAEVKKDQLILTASISSDTNPFKAVGGYLIITLVNSDQNPIIYKSVTGGELGKNGYPSSYKSGRIFNINKKSRPYKIRRKVSLEKAEEYYTELLFLVFSYKGSLLNKQSFQIQKEVFLE